MATENQKDPKGMYARARRGEITGFTGIDDPYEMPQHAEITLVTSNHSPEENVQTILSYLLHRGLVQSLY